MAKQGLTVSSLNDICFPVELRDNPRNTNREYSKVVTGIIDGQEFDLNYCSPRYELVPNSEIFPKIGEILDEQGIAYNAYFSHTNHARFYGKFVITDQRFAHNFGGKNDVIRFIWNFEHSYNGLTKYKGLAGYYREVCSNGLMVPIQEMQDHNLEVQGKHMGAILKSLKEFKGVLTYTIDNLKTVSGSIIAKYELLGGRMVTKPEDRIREVLEATKSGIVETKNFNTIDNITARVMSEAHKKTMRYNGKVNDWLIYNGINQFFNDDTLNITPPEKRREKDSKVLEYMLSYA